MKGKINKLFSTGILALTLSLGISPSPIPSEFSPPFASAAPQQNSSSFFDNFELVTSNDENYILQFTTAKAVKVKVSYSEKDGKNMIMLDGTGQGFKQTVKFEGLKENTQYQAVISASEGKTTMSETIYFTASSDPKVTVPSKEVSYSMPKSEIGIESHDVYESEYNGEKAYADPLAPATPMYGRISCSASDQDWFKIDVSAKTNGKLNVFLDVPSNKDYELYLYDANGNYLAKSTGGTGVDELISRLGTTPGTYYAMVLGFNGACDDVQNYMLVWRFYPDIAWPVPGSDTISDYFGTPRGSTTHKGLDITWWSSGGSTWKYEIQAVKDGYVSYASGSTADATAGYYVKIDHGLYNGKKIIARYLHMESQPLVSSNTNVTRAQRLGWMGNTGDSTGKHLHLDFSDGSSYYDPLTFLAKPHSNEVVDYWEKNGQFKQ
ncbi:peptidoglycan DD-metalloendopeptidase family protein [Effusibacillus consociatus]|uniref:Peptidoglycan DD-metalloendopeptidase family protein n=1 Tax=Effusibacillus consociatus TaxID=1117041 RepID=A0ABV9Q8J3_9BACL